MPKFEKGDHVRVDIPDESDPDHDAYHGKHGVIVDTLEDDAGKEVGNDGLGVLYRIELENGKEVDFREHDLRPPIA